MSPTFWSRIMGKQRYKETVYKSQASFEEQKTLEYGLEVDRPYRSALYVENYTKGTAANAQDLTATSDKLTVNKSKTILMYVDTIDKLQNKWDAVTQWGTDAGKKCDINIDAEYLYEVVNANLDVDDGDVGGTDGSPLTLSTSNISTVVSKINRKLDEQNVPRQGRFWNISPQMFEVLWAYIAGKESLLGDKTGEGGGVGKYGGLELYMTNNLTASAVWTPVDNPTDEATITIDGVVFTFQSVIGAVAGNVLQTTNLETTLTNLAHLINNPASTTANHVAFSGADLRTVQEMVAVATATYITVYHKGKSYMTVATSEALDLWSKATQHSLAGAKGAIDMVIQRQPKTDIASTVSAGKAGTNVMILDVFGVQTFNQGKNEIVNVKIATAAF